MNRLQTAIAAMDRLNSWVRSDSAKLWPGQHPREAIYWLKGQIIKEAHLQNQTVHRAIRTSVTCRVCGGSGTSWSGYECRKCDGGGTAVLSFVETRFADSDIVWHSPFLKLPSDIQVDWSTAELSTDWTPNQRGLDLVPLTVAACLNVVEDFITLRPRPGHTMWFYDHEVPYDPFGYTLYLGRIGDRCSVCTAENPVEGRYTVRRGCVTWLDNCCAVCAALYDPSGILAVFPTPFDLLNPPEIREWIIRHGRKCNSLVPQNRRVRDYLFSHSPI